jgi:hypothetical protein
MKQSIVGSALAVAAFAGGMALFFSGLPVSAQGGGSISGEVKFTGAAPAPKVVKVNKDNEVCGQEKKIVDVAVGSGGGLGETLVSVTDAELRTVVNGGKVGKNDGTDILFTAGDGTTKLNHELERYTATTGSTAAWVRIPSLSASVDTVVYVYYGNAAAADQQNKTGVWDSNYKVVNHLKDASGPLTDSTQYGNNGTASGGAAFTAGGMAGDKVIGIESKPVLHLADVDGWRLTTARWLGVNIFHPIQFDLYFRTGTQFGVRDVDDELDGICCLADADRRRSRAAALSGFNKQEVAMVSDYEQSAAYAALTPAGRRALYLIEGEVERGGGTAAISRVDIERPGLSRASVNFGLKQLGLLEFVTISVGRRRINTFVLADGWRSLNDDDVKRRVVLARLPKPQRPSSKPPKPVKASKPEPKPMTVERVMQRRMPSLPTMPWYDDGR